MKIQCDVCEKAHATVICCADEAALCAKCDIEVHAANKLASKHQRLLLQCLSNKLPPCDICREKPAFIFCVEDRALFCKDYGAKDTQTKFSTDYHENNRCSRRLVSPQPSWVIDELLQFLDCESSKKKEQLELGELEWLTDNNLFGEQVGQEALAAAEVPQLQVSQPSDGTSYKPAKFYMPHKKPRLEIPDDDDEEFFTVPDLG
ncbi:B-box zinc finger protein 25 [Abeliophyllum distichum]|uniref:B-box zinc finger protein 25 n=1 Tax=Abeliophyllum distichum TaxID=126358 RepID=A0ABD1RC55_9LAMI